MATRWWARTWSCSGPTRSKPPEELAAIVGLDLADPGLWDSGIDALAAELDEAEALAAEIGLGG